MFHPYRDCCLATCFDPRTDAPQYDVLRELRQYYRCILPGSHTPSNSGGNSYTYTAANCGGTLPASNGAGCYAGARQNQQSGVDEDWRHYINPLRVQWWIGSGSNYKNIQSDYLCPAAGSSLSRGYTFHRCSSSSYSTVGGSSSVKQTTFSAANCGNNPPPNSGSGCFAGLVRQVQSGRDRQWELKYGTQSMTVRWECSGCTANPQIEAVYMCPTARASESGWTGYSCYKEITSPSPASGLTFRYRFTASDCGGALPPSGSTCYTTYRTGFHQGSRSEDWRAFGPNESYGPGVEWWAQSYSGTARVGVDYLCLA